MNREIKFRMWHKKSKKMFDVESINFKDRIVNIWNSGMYSLSTFCLDDVILMQYTGLHDKNGKEIYEGDILKFSEVDTAIVIWNEKYAYFMVKPIQEYYFDSDVLGQALEYNDNVEVIGNEYDNPELLGGEYICQR